MNALPIRPYSNSRLAFWLPILTTVVTTAGIMGIANYAHTLQGTCAVQPCSPVVGSYRGTLVEAGSTDSAGLSTDPVETTFAQMPDGSIIGQYLVRDGSHSYCGKLIQVGELKNHKAHMEWTDQYGHGSVELTFDDDYCKFSGKWRNDEGTMLDEPWLGHKS